jgi:hypothetical protein
VGLRSSTGRVLLGLVDSPSSDVYGVEDVPEVDEAELDDDAGDVAVDVDPPEGADPPVVEVSAFLAAPSLDPLDDDESDADLRESLR